MKRFAGEWVEDRMEGTGYYYYDNGDVYRGNWSKNKRSGHGQMECPNGDLFDIVHRCTYTESGSISH